MNEQGKKETVGVVVGKFYPYHLGHQHLIREAYNNCDHLYVYVCHQNWHEIPGEVRVEWIREDFPLASVGIIDQDDIGLADDDSPGWARLTVDLVGQVPDVVFTSEDYGERWAKELGCRHHLVDKERIKLPISGTEVRKNPLDNLQWLPEQVRAYFVLRIAVIGAESTGKTTLSADLAQALGGKYVPEFGRHYTAAQPEPEKYPWTAEDFQIIARQQEKLENWWARHAGPVLIVDTTPFVTQTFCEAYLGFKDPEVEEIVKREKYDLILIPDPETPFVEDMGRRKELRGQMTQRYLEYAKHYPHKIVYGSPQERLEQALAAIWPLKAKWSRVLSSDLPFVR